MGREREEERKERRMGEGGVGGQREGENADIFFWCVLFLRLSIWAFTKQKVSILARSFFINFSVGIVFWCEV